MSAPAASSSSSSDAGSSAPSAWFDAARSDDLSDLTSVLSSGRVASLDARDSSGHTALMIACEGAAEECVRELLAKRAQMGLVDPAGRTALHLACDVGAVGCVRLLLEASTNDDQDLNVNATDSAGDSPLILACRALEPAVVRLLLDFPEQRCDTEIYNDAGETALLAAAAQCTQDSVKDAIEVMALLTSHPTNPAKITRPHKLSGQSALLLIISQGSLDGVRWILKVKGVDVDAQDAAGVTALMHCVSDELPIGLLKLLLESKASQLVQNKKGYTALHLAIRDDNPAMVDLLISQAPPQLAFVLDSEFSWTPLQHAVSQNKTEYVRAWGEKGLSVEGKDKRGSTAAHLAARFGFLTCLKYCIKHGASLDARDSTGSTALLDACASGQMECVKWLQSKGAAVEGKKGEENRGSNALHRTVEKEALHPAALDICKLLLESSPSASALLHAKNADGDTPWMVARRRGASHAAITSYFMEYTQRSVPIPPTLRECIASGSSSSSGGPSGGASGEGTVIVEFDVPENYKFMLLEHKYEATATPVLPKTDSVDGAGGEDGEVVALAKKKKVASKDGEEKKTASKKATTASTAAPASSPSKTKTAPSSSSAKASTAVKKSTSTTLSKEPRAIVHALPTRQTAIGTSSPLRISGLVPGCRYTVSLVSINSVGHRSVASSTAAPQATVLVGTPAAPSVTGVVAGATWATVTFVPGGGGLGAMTTAQQASGEVDKSAITEFILTATVVTSNPRHSAPVMTGSSSASIGSSPLHRHLRCPSSPGLLTHLTPGLTYTVQVRAKNGWGEGAHSGGKVVKAEEAPQGSAASSSSSHLLPLSPDLDRGDLSEASSLLLSSLGADLISLIRAQRKALGAGAGAAEEDAGVRIVRSRRVENVLLRTAYERAPLFMQSLGASRAESTRESIGVLCVTQQQAEIIGKYGVLPFAHPLSHAYQPQSSDTSPYNANLYPLGSPCRGCYVNGAVHKRTLMQAEGANRGGTSGLHMVLLCRFLPGRSRSDIPASSSAGSSEPSMSAAFDSHRSASGDQIMLYSTNQILPLYVVEFALELTSQTQEVVSEMDAVLAADAAQQVPDIDSASSSNVPPSAERQASLLSRGFGVSKWMGSAPAGSIAAPGELPPGGLAAPSSAAAASSGSSALGSGRRQQEEEDEEGGQERDEIDEQPRLNINQASSSKLGPVGPPKARPQVKTSSSQKK